ncbi:MAG: HK97 gp10 family phage protein [Hamadaea sp.]|nr:HK97 gp10 family phage protein [Hamadaea sp.]
MADAIRVDGLNEFVRNLKKLDSDAAKVLRVAFNAAGESITEEARAKVPTKSGRARASVKMRSTQTAARIVGGSKKAPYYPWLDFGGTTPKGGRRPFLKDGRYIYAAYFRQREGIAAKLELALINAAQAAGVEVD